MSSFGTRSMRWIARMLQSQRAAAGADADAEPVVLTGSVAAAAVEALCAEAAGLGAGFPASVSAHAWEGERLRRAYNAWGRSLRSMKGESPAGAMAAAAGAAMAGVRATVFLSGQDLAVCQDQLAQVAGRRVPLVVHVACRGLSTHADTLGCGHESVHGAADLGCVQFFASNVQEVADLTLIGRYVAERVLAPVIVAVDGDRTAMAAQDLMAPSPRLVREYLLEPERMIEPPTRSQRMVFGERRRLTPRWHDLERPVLRGAPSDPEMWAAAQAARAVFFDAEVPGICAEAFARFEKMTGRRYEALDTENVESASVLLVAQGAVVEIAKLVSRRLRQQRSLNVGVAGVRMHRPWPESELAARLDGAGTIVVLERADAPLAGEGPLTRQVRALQAGASRTAGSKSRSTPPVRTAVIGLGGSALRAADLAAYCERVGDCGPITYLGVEFARDHSAYPKRQSLQDTIRRDYAGITSLGLKAHGSTEEPVPANALTVAVRRIAGAEDEHLAGEVAGLLHGAFGGHLRTRPAVTFQRSDAPCLDWIAHSTHPLLDPGDGLSADIEIFGSERAQGGAAPLACLRDGGALIVPVPEDGSAADVLTARTIVEAARRGVRIFAAPVASGKAYEHARTWRRHEALLGAFFGVLASRADRPVTPDKAVALRERMLGYLPQADQRERGSAFARGLEVAAEVDVAALAAAGAGRAEHSPAGTPTAVRHFRRADSSLDSLPRFWDQVGVVVRDGNADELTPDPYNAVGAVPPLSASFHEVQSIDGLLPVFDPETCVGWGACWTSCPDGSIAAIAVSAQGILETGMQLVSARGAGGPNADALSMIAGRLGKAAHKAALSTEHPPTTAGALLRGPFVQVMEKMSPPEDRRAALEAAFAAVLEEIGELPISRTLVFLDEPEAKQAGSGAFLSLFVNPDVCKHGAAAVGPCLGKGLKLAPRSAETVTRARRMWRIFEQLPDTPGETIRRVAADERVGPLGALMLSRTCSQAMVGGDGAEPGSGARLALRSALAVCEGHYQPRVQRQIEEVVRLRGRISEQIRGMLADALPVSDLDALASGLNSLARDDVDIAALAARVGDASGGGRVDAVRLGRLVEVARRLADLEWRLSKGPDGLGRARVGLTIAPGSVAMWTAAYPYNPFQIPVTVDATERAAMLARGLAEGQIAQTIASVRTLRWATAELERPGEAERERDRVVSLSWESLTDEERDLCAPVLLVGDEQTLARSGLSSLLSVAGSELPVKMLVLSGIGGDVDTGSGADALAGFGGCPADVGMLAMLGRRAYVAQTSIAHPDHFADSVSAALAHPGPALVHVHAPSPERHGFKPVHMLRQAELAVLSRAFALFRFDPAGEGVFGTCIDLRGNPDPMAPLCHDADGKPLTPADWAVLESRFDAHFRLAEEVPGTRVTIAQYLDLPADQRKGVVATVVDPSDGTTKVLGREMVAEVERRVRAWRTVQELAGAVTPFTARVREEAERAVAASHEAELARIRREFEQQLGTERAEFEAEAAIRVREGLMKLAGYSANGGEAQAAVSEGGDVGQADSGGQGG